MVKQHRDAQEYVQNIGKEMGVDPMYQHVKFEVELAD
jgi:hypothetical protein